jgi:hypothetical protein
MPILQQCNPARREWGHTGELAFGMSRAKLATGLETSNSAKNRSDGASRITFLCLYVAGPERSAGRRLCV